MEERPDEGMEELLKGLREEYNPPPPTPREEMWSALQPRLEPRDGEVVSLDAAREAKAARRPAPYRRPLGWAAAAAAVLVVGVGIGRMTAPGAGPAIGPVAAASPALLRVAAVEHLVRTESLLTLVRADARSGRLEPAVGSWARSLLSETRLLLDAHAGADPVMMELLEDLELVLAQIVGVAHAGGGDQARVRSELSLALGGLDARDVLPRIQAVIPAGPGLAGT